MTSVPIFEAKNKLTQLIHLVEQDEANVVEITRHGKTVALLGKKENFKTQETEDQFLTAYRNFRFNLENSTPKFTEEEWSVAFEIPRQQSKTRVQEDFS